MPCEYEALSRRREPLTGQVWRRGVLSPRVNTQPVSHTRFTLSPLLTHFTFTIYTLTLTLVWLNYPSSFQTAFLHSIQLQFHFFFLLTSSASPIWFLFYSSSMWQPFFFTSSLFYITHFLCMFLCLLSKRSPLFFARFSLGVYSMRCAPFDYHHLRLAVFFFCTLPSLLTVTVSVYVILLPFGRVV